MVGEATPRAAGEGPWRFRVVTALCAAIAFPFARIETERLDVARRETTAVVIANHRSYFDALAALAAFRRLRRYPRVIVAAHWFDSRLLGPLLRAAGALPMDRDDPTAHLAAARRLLDDGVPVLILPEGTLSGEPGDPSSLGKFKTGAARLAAHCHAPVWPVALVGTDDVWPRHRRLPGMRFPGRHRRRVLVFGGDCLLEVEGDPRTDTDELHDAMQQLLIEAVGHHVSDRQPRSPTDTG